MAENRLTALSVHIESADVQVSQTKVWPEAITPVLTLANLASIKTTIQSRHRLTRGVRTSAIPAF